MAKKTNKLIKPKLQWYMFGFKIESRTLDEERGKEKSPNIHFP